MPPRLEPYGIPVGASASSVGFQPFTMRGMGRTVIGCQVQALMGLSRSRSSASNASRSASSSASVIAMLPGS